MLRIISILFIISSTKFFKFFHLYTVTEETNANHIGGLRHWQNRNCTIHQSILLTSIHILCMGHIYELYGIISNPLYYRITNLLMTIESKNYDNSKIIDVLIWRKKKL